jgi:hypothetical protein
MIVSRIVYCIIFNRFLSLLLWMQCYSLYRGVHLNSTDNNYHMNRNRYKLFNLIYFINLIFQYFYTRFILQYAKEYILYVAECQSATSWSWFDISHRNRKWLFIVWHFHYLILVLYVFILLQNSNKIESIRLSLNRIMHKYYKWQWSYSLFSCNL